MFKIRLTSFIKHDTLPERVLKMRDDMTMVNYNLALDDTINQLTIAVAKVDANHKIIGYNRCFGEWFSAYIDAVPESEDGLDFYKAIGTPFFFDGNYAPFYFADRDQKTATAIIGEFDSELTTRGLGFDPKKSDCTRIFSLRVKKISSEPNGVFHVELEDITQASRLEQRIEVLKSAGSELAEFTDRCLDLTEEKRKNKLKELIEKHMHDQLECSVFEIRILGEGPEKPLISFLNVGGQKEGHEDLLLYAKANDNGITGYVADSGLPYLCDDTENDAHYIKGAIDAKSSLTVPLFFCNRVIGVCNVESTKRHAFSKRDELFLQLYAKDLAMVIHLHNSISTTIQKLHLDCQAQLYSYLLPPISNLFDTTLSAIAESSAEIPLPILEKIIVRIFSLKSRSRDLKHRLANPNPVRDEEKLFESFSSTEMQDACKQFPDAVKYLKWKRVLFVAEDAKLDCCCFTVAQLEKLGCKVDVVRSTQAALQALQLHRFADKFSSSVKYDIVISDLNPDGCYFDGEPFEDAPRNPYGWSVYDIHEDNYNVPVGDEWDDNVRQWDSSVRQRIYNEIKIMRKLDAYFLKLEIDALGLSEAPLFILSGAVRERTHVRSSLSKLNDNREWPGFTVDPSKPEKLSSNLKSLLKSVSQALSQLVTIS